MMEICCLIVWASLSHCIPHGGNGRRGDEQEEGWEKWRGENGRMWRNYMARGLAFYYVVLGETRALEGGKQGSRSWRRLGGKIIFFPGNCTVLMAAFPLFHSTAEEEDVVLSVCFILNL